MIETYLLEQLDSFARTGTLSAAAEELHLTQPSITRSMQKLEGELGVTLFNRSRNKITLNETGKTAANYAAKMDFYIIYHKTDAPLFRSILK